MAANHNHKASRRIVRYKIPQGLKPWARGAKRASRLAIMQLQRIAKLDMMTATLGRSS